MFRRKHDVGHNFKPLIYGVAVRSSNAFAERSVKKSDIAVGIFWCPSDPPAARALLADADEERHAEAQELHASGAGAEVLQDPLRRARELLAVIDAGLAANRLQMPPDVRNGLEELRAELAQLQSGTSTTH